MQSICEKCNCYLNYIEDVLDEFNDIPESCQPCNFFDHAYCVAPVISHWQWSNVTSCPRACNSYSFHQESIQYADLGDNLRNGTYNNLVYTTKIMI